MEVLNKTFIPLNTQTKSDRDKNEANRKEELAAIRANFTDEPISWYDICTLEKFEESDRFDDDGNEKVPQCTKGYNPLNFIYEQDSGEYNLTRYDTDSKLIAKLQTGKGDPELY